MMYCFEIYKQSREPEVRYYFTGDDLHKVNLDLANYWFSTMKSHRCSVCYWCSSRPFLTYRMLPQFFESTRHRLSVDPTIQIVSSNYSSRNDESFKCNLIEKIVWKLDDSYATNFRIEFDGKQSELSIDETKSIAEKNELSICDN
jgi:hypothetical protein